MNELYKLKGIQILKDGHTMFLQDVVKELNGWRNDALNDKTITKGDKNE